MQLGSVPNRWVESPGHISLATTTTAWHGSLSPTLLLPIRVPGPRREPTDKHLTASKCGVDIYTRTHIWGTQPSKSYLAKPKQIHYKFVKTGQKESPRKVLIHAIGRRSGRRNGSRWATEMEPSSDPSQTEPNPEPNPCHSTPGQALSGPPPKVLPAVGCNVCIYIAAHIATYNMCSLCHTGFRKEETRQEQCQVQQNTKKEAYKTMREV